MSIFPLKISWLKPLAVSIAICLTFYVSTSAVAQTCVGAFISQAGTEIADLRSPNPFAVAVDELPRTVTVAGELAGDHGGRYLILKRTSSWLSYWRPAGTQVIQGDPRWFALIAGAKVGKFFGFRSHGADQITVPDAVEVNSALAKINSSLMARGKEAFTTRFYSVEGEISSEAYLRKWVEEGKLPLADQGDAAIHDISFHALAFILPEVALQRNREQFARVLQFADFFTTQLKVSGVRKREILALRKEFFDHASRSLDAATGNITRVFVHELFAQDATPVLDSVINSLTKWNGSHDAIIHDVFERSKIVESQKRLLKQSFDNFLALNPLAPQPARSSDVELERRQISSEFNQAIHTRLAELQAALGQIRR